MRWLGPWAGRSRQIASVVDQLKGYPRLLHKYLHALFVKDPHAGSAFHELQVELYAEYEPNKLLPFLRQSNHYPLKMVRAWGSANAGAADVRAPSWRSPTPHVDAHGGGRRGGGGGGAGAHGAGAWARAADRRMTYARPGTSCPRWCSFWAAWATTRRRST